MMHGLGALFHILQVCICQSLQIVKRKSLKPLKRKQKSTGSDLKSDLKSEPLLPFYHSGHYFTCFWEAFDLLYLHKVMNLLLNEQQKNIPLTVTCQLVIASVGHYTCTQ